MEIFGLVVGSVWDLVFGYLIPFIFVLAIVIFVHEMGHFLVGRWCGVGVDAFSIGFGPEMFGWTDRQGTRWKVSVIPLAATSSSPVISTSPVHRIPMNCRRWTRQPVPSAFIT